MAAILSTAVSLYPAPGPSVLAVTPSTWYFAGKDQKSYIAVKLKITGVTAGDTATPAVLGMSTIMDVGSAYSATNTSLRCGLDPTANGGTGSLIVGTGPSNETIYVTVYGTTKGAVAS